MSVQQQEDIQILQATEADLPEIVDLAITITDFEYVT